MWGSIWVCDLKHNDLGVLSMSGLCEHLLDKLPMVEDEDGNDVNMVLYRDSIFKPSLVILRQIEIAESEIEKLINNQMNSSRTSVEMLFGDLFNLFNLLTRKNKLKLLINGKYIRKLIIVIFFLHNCYTCMNGNRVYIMFNIHPPPIGDYLHLEDDHTLHTDDDDQNPLPYTYNYGRNKILYDSAEDIVLESI